MDRFEGKTILLAGGGGIASGVARRLAREGANVVIGDVRPEGAEPAVAAITSEGGEALAVALDLQSDESVQLFVESALAQFGQIDGLFNVAADTRPETIGADTTILDTDYEVWQQTLDVNLTGYFRTIRRTLPHLLERGGSIVNTLSASAYAGETVRVAYGVSKAGLTALTRHVANTYGRFGVRCNGIAPGSILSGVEHRLHPSTVELSAVWKGMVASFEGIPSPRLGTPDDIAALAAYLLADESGYVTGQSFGVDGGLIFR